MIAFDVNETLLDLRALDPVFEQVFGDASLRGQWFAQMLQLAFVGAITDRYVDFTTAQRAALDMVAQRRDVKLTAGDVDRVTTTMRELPAHPDVADALARLRAGGHRLAALSNSPEEVEQAQLAHAGLTDRFDAILSADTVRALKPRREPYELAARTFSVPTAEVMLVAAHAWDIAGALAAGCRAAFVARPGMPRSRSTPSPTSSAPTSARSPTRSSPHERDGQLDERPRCREVLIGSAHSVKGHDRRGPRHQETPT